MSLPTYNSSLVTTVQRVQQDLDFPQYVLGGRGGASGATYALFKPTTSYTFALWHSPVYQIGKPFDVLRIKIPVSPAITTNMTITPVLYFDSGQTSAVGTVINSTNYNGERLIVLTDKNFSGAANGKRNFFLELQFTGSALVTAKFPILIDLDIQP